MKKKIGTIRRFPQSVMAALVLSVMVWSISPVTAAAQTTAPSAKSDIQLLLDRAHSAEARGRMDQASQSWQQVLLSDPNNLEALAGMARAAKLAGRETETQSYLNRIRAINPNDPNIQRVESMVAQQSQLTQLQEAGRLAQSGQYDAAMKIYRQVFGNTPPPGDWALAYYQTESATADGKGHAIAGLRELINQYPKDSRYQIVLGTILTYNPRTRAEGREWLEKHPQDPDAMKALRNSLLWDAANPNMAPVIRAYVAKHPDPELSARMADALRHSGPGAPYVASPEELARRAQNAEEAAAYSSLNARRLDDAEARFQALLAKEPNNPRALAGMGYLRMNQGNFGGAITYLEQAQQNGARDASLNSALATSRFWYVMGDASAALNENDLATAEGKYSQALQMKPNSPEAMEGLGGTYMKAQNPTAAIPLFESEVKIRSTLIGWRGLFEAEYQAGRPEQALEVERRIPASIRAQLRHDPEFLRTLASAYSAVGRDADAQKVLREALDMPFPQDGRGMHADVLIQYAELLMTGNRPEQAAGLFRQALSEDPTSVGAWQGLIRAEHATGHDAQAVQTMESMDQMTYEVALRDPGFLTIVASIYQSQNQLEVAQHYLEQAYSQRTQAGQQVPANLQLQLASVYMLRNDPQRAFALYRQVLQQNPNNVDAWKGMLGTLHQTDHDREALAQIQVIPKATRLKLEADVDYLQTVGSIYNALGDSREAIVFLNRVQQHYAAQHVATPPDVEIQNAWLLFNSGNEQALYQELMILGARPDLTLEQRRTVQTIWASYAVRRANQAEAAGNTKLALQILNASAHAFPDNPAVSKALAGGYIRAGLPKAALAIYKTEDLTTGSAQDYKSAIGAALAAQDYKLAENWLRYGLAQYPNDPQLLSLAADFEKARGNPGRAVDFYNKALASLPPPDPGEELTDALNQPVAPAPTTVRPPSPDLATLLKPNQQPVIAIANQPEDTRPYLPSYMNPLGTTPPVQFNTQQPVYNSNSSTPAQTTVIDQTPVQSVTGSIPLRDYVPQQNMNQLQINPYMPAAPAYTSQQEIVPASPQQTYAPQQTYTQQPGYQAYTPVVPSTSNAPAPVMTQSQPYTTQQQAPAYQYQPVTPQTPAYSQPVPQYTPGTQPTFRAPVVPGSNATTSPGATSQAAPQTFQDVAPAYTPSPRVPTYGPLGGTGQGTLPSTTSPGTTLQENNIPPDGTSVPQAPIVTPQTVPNYSPGAPSSPNPVPAPVLVNPTQGEYSPYESPMMTQRSQIAAANRAALDRFQPVIAEGSVPATTGTVPTAAVEAHNVPQTATPPAGQIISTPNTQNYVVYTPQPADPRDAPQRTLTQLPVLTTTPVASITQASQQEQTDVLPRYVPNAPGTSGAVVHPDIAAVRDQAIRDNQSLPPGTAPATTPTSVTSQGLSTVGFQSSESMAQNAGDNNGFEQQYPKPNGTTTTTTRRPTRRATTTKKTTTPAQPAPSTQQPLSYPYPSQPAPGPTTPINIAPYPLPPGPSDNELIQRNVPPLRGQYYTYSIAPSVELTQREQTQNDLDRLNALYSSWIGGSGYARYRSGSPGFDRLIDLEAPFEATVVAAKTIRFSVIPKPVFLNSGVIDPNTVPASCAETTAAAAAGQTVTCTAYLGTFPVNTSTTVIPAQQLANGMAGEAQISTQNFGIALGYTPYQFLVSNVTGRFRWKILGGPITIYGDRDSVKDSQLSYAGLRDPGASGNVNPGPIWGGVVHTIGGARADFGNERSGFYVGMDGGTLTGYHTEANSMFEGTMGAYWRAYVMPGYGSLNLGANFYGSHYKVNELGYSYGLGGYFSPDAYFLAGMPITWTGHYGTKWHYIASGSIGIQAFQEGSNAFFPLDPALMTSVASSGLSPYLPITSSAGLNYNLNARGSYHVKDHWFVGGYITGNNTNNYNTITAGFFVRYLFHSQYPTEEGPPTGIFPTDAGFDGLRPLRIP